MNVEEIFTAEHRARSQQSEFQPPWQQGQQHWLSNFPAEEESG